MQEVAWPREDKWGGRDWQGFTVKTERERPALLEVHDHLGRRVQQHTFYPVDGEVTFQYFDDRLRRGVYRVRTLGVEHLWEAFFGPNLHVVTADIEELADGTFHDPFSPWTLSE